MTSNGVNYPGRNRKRIDNTGPRAKSEYASKRANGTINTHPQARMRASTNREMNPSELF